MSREKSVQQNGLASSKIGTKVALKILVVVLLRSLRNVENSPECHRMSHLRLEQPTDGSNSTVGEWTGGWKMEGRRRNGGVTRGSRRKKSKKEGRTERRREPEENWKWRKWKERGNGLGKKLGWGNNNQQDRIDSTYALLCVKAKSERQEKGAKEGELHCHCSHRTIRLSMTTMTNLSCNNQPSCDSNVSMG